VHNALTVHSATPCSTCIATISGFDTPEASTELSNCAAQIVNGGMFSPTTGKIDDRWRKFMTHQIGRTRDIFAGAEAGVDQLAPDARLPVWCALVTYSAMEFLLFLVGTLKSASTHTTPACRGVDQAPR